MPPTKRSAVKPRPFHQSIVDAINEATGDELWCCLTSLIEATKIPAGHDKIIAAWNNAWRGHNLASDCGIPAYLRAEKREAAAKKADKKCDLL